MYFVINCDIELDAGRLRHGDIFDQPSFLKMLNDNELEYVECIVCNGWIVASDWQSSLRCKAA